MHFCKVAHNKGSELIQTKKKFPIHMGIYKYMSLTFEERRNFPNGNGTQTGELTIADLQEEEGHSTQNQKYHIGNQESTCNEKITCI